MYHCKNINGGKLNFILYYFLVKKVRLSIDPVIDNKNKMHDLYVIDNLHDFLGNRATGDIKLSHYIRTVLLNLLIDNDIKKLLLLINNDVNEVRDKIFQIFKLDNCININDGEENNLPNFNINKNDIYFETNGIFNVANMICPYKNAIDKANCSNDTIHIRDNLRFSNGNKFNNYQFNIENYDANIINIHVMDNDIKFNLENHTNDKYYLKFMSEHIPNHIKRRGTEHINKQYCHGYIYNNERNERLFN